MKILFRIVLFAALIALGYWLWTVFFPSPETVIRKRLNKVAELASFKSGENTIIGGAKILELVSYFAPNIEIIVDTPVQSRQTLTGNDELQTAALGVRQSFRGLQVELLDQNIQVSADKTEATVNLTGKARLPGDRDMFVQELKFFLRKIEGKWLIIRVETVRTLT